MRTIGYAMWHDNASAVKALVQAKATVNVAASNGVTSLAWVNSPPPSRPKRVCTVALAGKGVAVTTGGGSLLPAMSPQLLRFARATHEPARSCKKKNKIKHTHMYVQLEAGRIVVHEPIDVVCAGL